MNEPGRTWRGGSGGRPPAQSRAEIAAVVAIRTGLETPRFAIMRTVGQAKQKPLVLVEGAGVVDGSGGCLVRRTDIPRQTKAEKGAPQEVAKIIADLVHQKKGG